MSKFHDLIQLKKKSAGATFYICNSNLSPLYICCCSICSSQACDVLFLFSFFFFFQPYLHESRHQHAMRRARGTGGRFAKKIHADASNNTTEGTSNDPGPVLSSQSGSGSSSISEPLPSDSADRWIFPHGEQGTIASQVLVTSEAKNHVHGGTFYLKHNGLQTLTHHSLAGEKGEEGDCSGQQRGSISSNQASQRPLSIQ